MVVCFEGLFRLEEALVTEALVDAAVHVAGEQDHNIFLKAVRIF